MPDDRSPFVPKAETWLWDVLDPNADVPVAWLRERFVYVAKALQRGEFSRDAAIVPRLGAKSKLASVAIDGGRDAKFVVVYARDIPANWMPGFQETLTYSPDVAGTDLIYDLTGEFLQGKARPFIGDFRELPLRVYAVLPFQLEQIDLAAQQRVQIARGAKTAGEYELPVRLRFLDGRSEPISARLPYDMQVRHSGSGFASGTYLTAQPQADNAKSLFVPIKPLAGRWTLSVRSMLTGDEATLPFEVSHVAGGRDIPKTSLTSKGLQVRRAPNPVKLDGCLNCRVFQAIAALRRSLEVPPPVSFSRRDSRQ